MVVGQSPIRWVLSLILFSLVIAHASASTAATTTAATVINAADTSNLIQVPAPSGSTNKNIVINGNGKTVVNLWFTRNWNPAIKVLNSDGNIVQIQETHATGQIITLNQVAAVYFQGVNGLNLPKLTSITVAKCGSTASGATTTLVGTISGTVAATTQQCPYGGKQPTTTTTTQVQMCINGQFLNQGAPTIVTANSGNPTCNPPAPCGSTPSGSTVTQTVGTTFGTIAATTQQCPYGGKQPTTTTVTQVELCTNGVLSIQGAELTTTANSGSPACNAPASCGSTPSGSTVTQTVSTTLGTIAATPQQCPNGGTQPTTTTVTQVELCTNGVLSNRGAALTTTANSGSPTCNAAASCGETANGSTITKVVSTTAGSIAALTSQCPNGGTQPTTTTVTQVQLCTNGVLSNQGAQVTTIINNGNPTCNPGTTTPVNGACGASNGQSFAAAPATGLCTAGTASVLAGGGPWNWTCTGSSGGTNASCAAAKTLTGLIYAPTVPQPAASNDIIGVIIQNPTAQDPGSHVISFGQVFIASQLLPTDHLILKTNGGTYPLQMDALASWPDGSVKLASLSLQADIPAGTSLPGLLAKATASDPVLPSTPVSLTNALLNLDIDLIFTGGQYTGSNSINLGTALKVALTSKPDYWRQGPLATEARVDYPLPGGQMHLTADVTAYADGNIKADVQFNNDLAGSIKPATRGKTGAPLTPLSYTATVTLNGQTATYPIAAQSQYQDWHAVLTTNNAPALNVVHDISYLEHTGAILPYDLTTGVGSNLINGILRNATTIVDLTGIAYGQPLAHNGVTFNMNLTGGRPDIGFTTQWNTVYLMTQNASIAALSLAQGDTAGSVSWNYKMPNGHWMTPVDAPGVWVGNSYTPCTICVVNSPNDFISATSINDAWVPGQAHQPDLSFIPYIMTGSRWNLDRLNAQAAWDISSSSFRQATDDILLFGDSPRHYAWDIRQVQEAAFIGKPGTFEQNYFAQVATDNWIYIKTNWIQTAINTEQGQTAGWFYDSGTTGVTDPWQDDFITAMAALGAEMGFSGGKDYIDWERDTWLTGRFLDPTMQASHDGVIYNMVAYDKTTLVPYNTWAQIETATVAAGLSNNGKPQTGDYGALAYGAFGAAVTVFPSDTQLKQALQWHIQNNWNNTQENYFATIDPTWNVVPLH